MRKNIVVLMAIVFAIFVASVSSAVTATPMSMASGVVTDTENKVVSDAKVLVTCTHNGLDTEKEAFTDVAGKYYVFFGSTECGDSDNVVARTDGAKDVGGIMTYDAGCKINTLKINLQVPEFGVVAGALALLAGIGIVAYRRK